MCTARGICPFLACVVITTTVDAEPQRLVDLFKDGQLASFTRSDRRTYSITIYTNDKQATDLLARYQKKLDSYSVAKAGVDLLAAKLSDIVQQHDAANEDEQQRLQVEYAETERLRNQASERMGKRPQKTEFHRVTKIGIDFVGLAMDGNRTKIIPVAFIDELILEDVEDESEP